MRSSGSEQRREEHDKERQSSDKEGRLGVNPMGLVSVKDASCSLQINTQGQFETAY